MRTVGVLQRLEDRKVIEIAERSAWSRDVPSTNPTSTAIYKILIALKARCAIVISRIHRPPLYHPRCGDHE